MAADKSAARPERHGLLVDQPIEIKGALIARWRRPHGAERGEQQHHGRGRNAKEHPDRMADPVEVAQRDTIRIGREHLPIGQIVAVCE